MPAPTPARVEAVRRFNRFYTRRIGVLSQGHLGSPHSLTEVRVLYEIAHREQPTAAEIGTELALDAGYLSRILARCTRAGLVARTRSAQDGRRSHLGLTRRGRERLAALDERARTEVGRLLEPLSASRQNAVTAAMRVIEVALAAPPQPTGQSAGEVVLRDLRPGDLGWVVYRHGALYAEAFGWNLEFEGMVAGIAAGFVANLDPARERAWIADRGGERLGSVFLVKESMRVARLRMLLVEPEARGLGLGTKLVDACTEFARAAGYRKIVLLTNSLLAGARRIYARAGYRMTAEEHHHSWGKDQVSETWELAL